MTAVSQPPRRRPLNGWKEIATYLGKSVRSVQRWEATLKLPVHRIKTRDGHILYADADEIDAWRRSLDFTTVQDPVDPEAGPDDRLEVIDPVAAVEPAPLTLWRRSAWMVVVGVTILVAGVAWGRHQAAPPPVPVDFRLGNRALEALSPDGSVLWTHRFDRDVSEISGLPQLAAQVLDVDGDGESEILAFVRFAQRGRRATISDGLFCFGIAGGLKWSLIPERTLSFRDESYSAPWRIQDFALSDMPGPRRLWIAVAHHTWWPSFVLEVAANGTADVRYVQGGRIFALAHWITPAGGVLAVGGVTNERSEATVALLQDGDPAASFPERGSGPYACMNCPDALPHRVLVFATAEHANLFPRRHPFVTSLDVTGADLKVSLDEAVQPPGMHAVATIGPNRTLRSLRFADVYWRIHRELEQAQRIHHPVEDCPDRDRPRIVREWISAGWREIHVDGEASVK